VPDVAPDAQGEIILKLAKNRPLAHRVLFAHRHPNSTPPFHREMIRDWHSREPNHCDIAFRGSAKSTIGEEALVIMALFHEFQNCIIFGASFPLAAQRLHSIRREFEKNEALRQLFGDVRGQPWADDKIETTRGVVIQAMGRGQALRGTKEEVKRPDLLWFDDIEDEESVRTPESRDKMRRWVLGEAIPAGDEKVRVRITANDMDPECLANWLDTPGSGFSVRRYPWEYKDEDGQRRATWEDRFPLPVIDAKRSQMVALGRLAEYNREYMCRSETPELKPFKSEMFRIEVKTRTWEMCQAMFDPARTVKASSATTGYACWSWIANRLIVWDAWGKQLMPDEIVGSIFAAHEEHHPATIGVEEDGLNEFLLQPIRHEQVRRGETIPVRAMRAPKGKLDFIRGLQPFFNAREIWFAKPLPDLQAQLLSFPSGRIDVPNALAYALKMRPGAPYYDDFSARHASEDLGLTGSAPVWLCLNATNALVTAQLTQLFDGGVRIVADWVREGDPGSVVSDIIQAANLEAGRIVRPICAPSHWDKFHNVGLVQAVKAIPMEMRRGAAPETGRPHIRSALRREIRGQPALKVAFGARWTLNAFAGGYTRALLKGGFLADHAEEGPYRVLMEGLEAFAGLLSMPSQEDEEDATRYAWTPDGRRYITAKG
jgi:hypothetical protein